MSAFSPAADRTARCARREKPSRAPEGLRGEPGTEGSCAWKSYPLGWVQWQVANERVRPLRDQWAYGCSALRVNGLNQQGHREHDAGCRQCSMGCECRAFREHVPLSHRPILC